MSVRPSVCINDLLDHVQVYRCVANVGGRISVCLWMQVRVHV